MKDINTAQLKQKSLYRHEKKAEQSLNVIKNAKDLNNLPKKMQTNDDILRKSIILNDMDTIKNILKSNDSINLDFATVGSITLQNIELMKLLIDNGLDTNTTIDKLPLIAFAVMYGNIEILKLLINNGADINITVNDQPLVVYSFLFCNIEVIKLLIDSGTNINIKVGNLSLIEYGIIYGNIQVIELLIRSGLEVSNLSLSIALMYGYDNIAKFIISLGVDINKESEEYDNILIELCDSQDKYIFNREFIIKITSSFDNSQIEFESIITDIDKSILNLYEIKEITLSSISINQKFDLIKLLSDKDENPFKKNMQILIDNDFKVPENDKTKKNKEKIKNIESSLSILNKAKDQYIATKQQLQSKIAHMTNQVMLYTTIDFIELFVKCGGDVNVKDNENFTALICASYQGRLDVVKCLLKHGANINIKNDNNIIALNSAYMAGEKEITKVLIEHGSEINIEVKGGKKLYDIAKYNGDNEIVKAIEKSPLFIKANTYPINLVKILTNFTIDKPIKYTTHTWDFGELKKEYGDFDGYMEEVKKQFESMKDELKELSPNLYEKVYTFLIETNPPDEYSWCTKTDINIGWSSIEGLDDWCNRGKNPFDFKLTKAIIIPPRNQISTFGEVINLFKQEIELRNDFKNLENIFNIQKNKLSGIFKFSISNSKLSRQFYTDTQKFTFALDKIFAEINKRKKYPNIDMITTELEDRSIEIKITQIDSISSRNADELLKRAKEAGDIADIVESLKNLCDYSIESSYEDTNFRVNFLHSNNVKDIVEIEEKPKGFTHILRFYK